MWRLRGLPPRGHGVLEMQTAKASTIERGGDRRQIYERWRSGEECGRGEEVGWKVLVSVGGAL